VCIGQVRTYCQGSLGFGLPPLMIAAPVERNTKAGVRFCIATIERDRAPCQCFFRASRLLEIARLKYKARSVEGDGKPGVSSRKNRI
jgi:hypothetical protein